MQALNIFKSKPIILLWLCLTSTAPFIFFSWPGHPYKLLTFLCLAIMVYQLIQTHERKVFSFPFFTVIMLQISFYVVSFIYYKDVANINLSIQLISLFIIITYIIGFIGFKPFVKTYIYIMLLMGIGGTIIFFLHLFIGIKPLFSVQYSPTGTSYYLWITTTNVYYDVGNLRLLRFSGFFDEPGTYALYSIFAIILNRVYFKDTRVENWLIFVTLFTLSLAFYFVMFFYFIFFHLKKSNFKYFFIGIVAIGGLYFYLSANTDNESLNNLYKMTFKRFEVDDSGSGLAENNRSRLSANDKEVFFNNPLLGVGSANEEVYGSNLYSIFARYGIIGFVFYYGLLFYLLFLVIQLKHKKVFYFKILFLITINFYHRPEMSSVFAMLFFVALIAYVRDEVLKQDQLHSFNKMDKLEVAKLI